MADSALPTTSARTDLPVFEPPPKAGAISGVPTVENAAGLPRSSVERRFFTYSEAGLIFGRSPRTIRLWVAEGHLRAAKLGRGRLIPLSEILRLSDGLGAPEPQKAATPASTDEYETEGDTHVYKNI